MFDAIERHRHVDTATAERRRLAELRSRSRRVKRIKLRRRQEGLDAVYCPPAEPPTGARTDGHH